MTVAATDLLLIQAAADDALAMTSDGYRWGGRPVDDATTARITALLNDGTLVEATPGADYTLLKATGSAVPR